MSWLALPWPESYMEYPNMLHKITMCDRIQAVDITIESVQNSGDARPNRVKRREDEQQRPPTGMGIIIMAQSDYLSQAKGNRASAGSWTFPMRYWVAQ